jgi:hypothetical protein
VKIVSVVERPEGNFEFVANLTEMQQRFLLEYAIRDLIAKGLIPFDAREIGGEVVGIVQARAPEGQEEIKH